MGLYCPFKKMGLPLLSISGDPLSAQGVGLALLRFPIVNSFHVCLNFKLQPIAFERTHISPLQLYPSANMLTVQQQN